LCLLIASSLLLCAGLAEAGVILYVGGSTTTPCPGTSGVALGDVTVSVNQAGVINDGTYLTVTINPGILASTPIARGTLASKGYVTFIDGGNVRFTFTGTGAGSTMVGDYLTFGSMLGNAPSYDTLVTASVGASDTAISFTNATATIASVSAANCVATGHILTTVGSLSFGGPPRSAIPSQSFTITNSGRPGQNLYPAVSAVYPAGSAATAWLIPVAGAESAGVTTVTVSIDITGLAEGDYTGSVRIDSAYADNSPLFVTVVLKIGKPGRIDLSTTSMTFVASPGQNPPAQNLIVKNGGTGLLAPDAGAMSVSGGAWLFVVTSSDRDEDPAVFQVTVFSASLAMGTYKGQITISSNNAFNSPQTVSVTLVVKNPTPTIALSPQSLTFQSDLGTSPAAKTVNITNSDTGELAWQAQATTYGGGNWLSVSPAGGNAPSTVNVTVSSAGLPAGTYTGTIAITSSSADVTNTPQTVSVTLTISAVTPAVAVTASSLSFTADVGGTPVAQSFTVNNAGTGSLSWTASVSTSSGGNWLSITPTSGAAGTGVQVTVNSAALAVGAYSGTITITSSSPGITNPTLTIPVSLLVRSTTPTIAVTPAALTFSAAPGGAAPPAQTVSLMNAGAGVLNWTATVTTASGGNWLLVTPVAGAAPSTLTVSIDNSRLGVGKFTGSILLKSIGAADVTIPVEFTTGTPKVDPNGIVNAAHLAGVGVSPGGLISIFGSNLASAAKPAPPIPYLPDELGGTSVKIGTFKARLAYVSPTQINAQVPVELSDQTTPVKVSVGGLETDAVTMKVLPYDPGLFTFDGVPAGPVAALKADYSAVSAASPAQRLTVIMLFGTGFGPVSPSVGSGQPGQGSQNLTVQTPVVLFGDRPGRVLYSGLAAGLVGVYQVNVEVPADAPTGDAVPVIVGIGGRGTNTAKISIR
jgi:uncharacterized protein (TIGR03437 family)